MNTEQRSTLGTILSIIGGTSALVVVAMWAAGVNDRLSELQKVDRDGQLYPFVVRDLQQLRSDFDHTLTNHQASIDSLKADRIEERGRVNALIDAEQSLCVVIARMGARWDREFDLMNSRLLQLERPNRIDRSRFEFHGLPYIVPTNLWIYPRGGIWFTNAPLSVDTNWVATNQMSIGTSITGTNFLSVGATNCWHEWSSGTSDREAFRRMVDEHKSDPDHFPEIQQCRHCGKTRSRKVTAWR